MKRQLLVFRSDRARVRAKWREREGEKMSVGQTEMMKREAKAMNQMLSIQMEGDTRKQQVRGSVGSSVKAHYSLATAT